MFILFSGGEGEAGKKGESEKNEEKKAASPERGAVFDLNKLNNGMLVFSDLI